MQILLLTTAFAGYFVAELYYEVVAETTATYYYGDLASLFWGMPSKDPHQLALEAATGPEVEYLRQICSMPFL